jgi:hypothetical protein
MAAEADDADGRNPKKRHKPDALAAKQSGLPHQLLALGNEDKKWHESWVKVSGYFSQSICKID